MAEYTYTYIIVGAGLAGGSAVEGIRQQDQDGSILLIGREPYLPYHRPPLTKKLWFGKETVEKIFVQNDEFYTGAHADLRLGTVVSNLRQSRRLAI
jgi:3-phenylpropionate/trans-cinnamate dioxygenase ferredoxin reductase component